MRETLLALTAPAAHQAVPRFAATTRASYGAQGSVAVIPIHGVISHRPTIAQEIFGGTSIARLTAQFRQALADYSVRTIVLDIDSLGGQIFGMQELAEEIFRSRARKRSVAVANSLAASGAYWLASSATELVVTPSGEVGSIGIFAVHEDHSVALEKAGVRISFIAAGRYKTDGNAYQPLSVNARSDLLQKVNAIHSKFVDDVARGRGVGRADVLKNFGQGRTVLASRAVAYDMVDRIETLDDAIARLTRLGGAPRSSSLNVRRKRLELACRDHPMLDLRRRQLELACLGDRKPVRRKV